MLRQHRHVLETLSYSNSNHSDFRAAVANIVTADNTCELLATGAACLGSPSTAEPSVKLAASNLIASLSSILQIDPHSLVAVHAVDILSRYVKPYFEPANSLRSARNNTVNTHAKLGKPPRDYNSSSLQSFEAQPWKLEFPESVAIFDYVVRNSGDLAHSQDKDSRLAKLECRKFQQLVVPTVLTLLDDWESSYKILGMQLLRHSVISMILHIRETGLGNVFFESLRVCLTFHSMPDVLRETFPAIIELTTALELPGSEAFMLKLDVIMQEGVIRGLKFAIGGKLDVIRTILTSIRPLCTHLNIISVKYLQSLLPLLCEILQLHSSDTPTQLLCADAILALLQNTWIIHVIAREYKGRILKACCLAVWDLTKAESVERADPRLTVDGDEVENRKLLKKTLKEIVTVLDEICGDGIKDDFQLLLKLDSTLFKELLPARIHSDSGIN